jgi:hypothetical protein
MAFAIDRDIINEFMLSMTSAGRLKAILTQSMVQDADKYHGSGQAGLTRFKIAGYSVLLKAEKNRLESLFFRLRPFRRPGVTVNVRMAQNQMPGMPH